MFLTNLIRKFIQQYLNLLNQEIFFPKDDFDTEKLTFHQYAAAQAQPAALASALLKLYEDNAATLTPDPLYARFYYSHPPAVERLAQLQRQESRV